MDKSPEPFSLQLQFRARGLLADGSTDEPFVQMVAHQINSALTSEVERHARNEVLNLSSEKVFLSRQEGFYWGLEH
jgi:hypothetical protein